jgi:hypothetical protein
MLLRNLKIPVLQLGACQGTDFAQNEPIALEYPEAEGTQKNHLCRLRTM